MVWIMQLTSAFLSIMCKPFLDNYRLHRFIYDTFCRYLGMKDFGLPVKMMERVEKGSAAYEGKFRNLDYDLSSSADFGVVVMKQDPI